MKRKLILSGSALLSLLCVAGVQAEEGVSGHVEATGKSIDVNGNKAKFSEYGDADSGVTGGVEMKYDAESGFLNFTADEIARDTQNFNLEAGQYGKFKLDAFYKEIQHNNTFDAKTFYTGVGTNNLTTTATSASLPTNAATWPSVFDYEVSRDQYGAGIKLNMMKPFFADFSVFQEDRKGIKAAGVYSGVSIELPEPVDYETNTFKAEVGYGEDPFFASLSYLQSNFDNANQNLYFTSLAAANTSEFLTLPPNNDYSKFAFKGRVKMPMSSTLAVNLSKSKAESDFNLASAYNTNGSARTNTLSDNIFNGQVDTLSYGVILTSSPVDFLDAKLHYSGYEKENKSDEITSSVTSGTTTTTFDNHLFDYDKTSYGLEAGFKLPAHVKLTPYYKNVKVERHRGDLPETDDDIYGLNARWTGLEKLAVHAGYERMNRDADWQRLILAVPGTATAASPSSQQTADAIEPYIRRFDGAPQDRDTFKVGLDLYPTDNLNIGLGYKHKKSDYTDTVLGLNEEKSNIFDVSADYTVGNVTLAGYLSYDKTEHFQDQRRLQYATANLSATNTIPPLTAAQNLALVNPLTDTTVGGTYSNNQNWQANTESVTYDYGASVEVAVVPNIWRVKVQYDHVKSDGFADYTYSETVPTGYTNDTVDSENWDDYTKDSLQLKLIFEATKNLTLTGVYAYEDYEYNDQFSDGYTYVVNTGTSYSYLTGAGMDPNYIANVFFLTAKYKF